MLTNSNSPTLKFVYIFTPCLDFDSECFDLLFDEGISQIMYCFSIDCVRGYCPLWMGEN